MMTGLYVPVLSDQPQCIAACGFASIRERYDDSPKRIATGGNTCTAARHCQLPRFTDSSEKKLYFGQCALCNITKGNCTAKQHVAPKTSVAASRPSQTAAAHDILEAKCTYFAAP